MRAIASLLLSVVALAGDQESSVSLKEVGDLLAAEGPSGALAQLADDDAKWASLIEQVATGRAEWLEIAAGLRGVGDAHASAKLAIAIQEALPANPAGVLRLVAERTFTLEEACGMYGFGQVEDERPMQVVVGLVDKRITAVSKLKDARLTQVRDDCVKELTSLRSQLRGKES